MRVMWVKRDVPMDEIQYGDATLFSFVSREECLDGGSTSPIVPSRLREASRITVPLGRPRPRGEQVALLCHTRPLSCIVAIDVPF